MSDQASNAKQKQEPVEAVIVDIKKTARNINIGRYFWSSLLILIGVLLLLENLQIVNVDFGAIWTLWPILIIGAGVSMLALRGWFASLVVGLLIIVTLMAVTLVSVDNSLINRINSINVVAESLVIDRDAGDITETDITVKTGAIELNISSDETEGVASANLTSRGFGLVESSEVRGTTQYVDIGLDARHIMMLGRASSKLDLALTKSLPLSLKIETGASQVNGDLSDLQLKKLQVSAGASDIDLTIGDKQAVQDIIIEAGASAVTLRVPASSGVRIYTETGLTDNSFKDIPKKSNGLFETSNYETASSKITIHAQLGVSSFTVDRY